MKIDWTTESHIKFGKVSVSKSGGILICEGNSFNVIKEERTRPNKTVFYEEKPKSPVFSTLNELSTHLIKRNK